MKTIVIPPLLCSPLAYVTFLYYSADYAALRDLTDYLWEDCCKGGTKAGCC